MKIGTKSVLFGAHQFLIHPFFVALAWKKLYGFPWDPRLWVAFFVHDLGYIGKPNMDGEEGEAHVELGAKIMGKLFGKSWHDFCMYHSRFYSKRDNTRYSKLCVADKLAIVLTPAWFYVPMARLTGEINEYMALAKTKYKDRNYVANEHYAWFEEIKGYLRKWVEEYKEKEEGEWRA